ncbi:MAG: tetratricopeptide repeat protein [Acidobacteria bacterium]|jgi:tetratricopeptide (TPR) repeat protein|nr:tetratricopeptide repeat protein [Acidobacteriota bacterium]
MGTRLKILALCALLFLPFALAAADVRTLISQGHADEAINTLQASLNGNSKDAESYNLLGRAYFSMRDWDRAIAAGEKAVALAPNNSQYHLWLGRAYGEKADGANFLSAASLAGKLRNEFETAVKLDPNNIDARSDLAEFYLEAPGIVGGGRDKAEAQAEALDKLAPAKAHWVRGRIAEKRKDLTAAEKEYRAAIEASHGGAHAWFNLALFYRHQQRWDAMEETLYRAVAAPMDRPEVLMESGEVLFRSGRNFPAAIEWLRRYLASSNMVEEAPAFKAHYLLGSVLEKQGDKPGAAQEYRAALALAKDYSPAKEALKKMDR